MFHSKSLIVGPTNITFFHFSSPPFPIFLSPMADKARRGQGDNAGEAAHASRAMTLGGVARSVAREQLTSDQIHPSPCPQKQWQGWRHGSEGWRGRRCSSSLHFPWWRRSAWRFGDRPPLLPTGRCDLQELWRKKGDGGLADSSTSSMTMAGVGLELPSSATSPVTVQCGARGDDLLGSLLPSPLTVSLPSRRDKPSFLSSLSPFPSDECGLP